MPFKAIAVANHLIERARADGEALNPMKIQKLVYFAHGWHLAIHDAPLLLERVEAWRYGPVIRELYHELKVFGSDPVEHLITITRIDRGEGPRMVFRRTTPAIEVEGDPAAAANAKALINRVFEIYGPYSAIKLSNATHADGSPWDITWKQCKGERFAVIDDELIKRDFKRRLEAQAAVRDGNA